MEEWAPVAGFPDYAISNEGRIRRERTQRILRTSTNQYGVACIGMMREGRQHHRSVALLVASAFLPQPSPVFDTPIHLDGDRQNNDVGNLMWRPRWFAIEYNKQFEHPWPHPIRRPIEDIKHGGVYANSFEVATTFGLLEKDVVLSITNHTYSWPTYQEFRVIEE